MPSMLQPVSLVTILWGEAVHTGMFTGHDGSCLQMIQGMYNGWHMGGMVSRRSSSSDSYIAHVGAGSPQPRAALQALVTGKVTVD